jgi:NAD(P)-dependent dehydrogenase (short-subunit alcohol dehydrogenase family)
VLPPGAEQVRRGDVAGVHQVLPGQQAPARVVTVASHAQAMGRIDFDDLQGERSYSGARAYNQSKLANVLFTYEQARRLRAHAVTATTLHPGVVRTAFGAEDPGRLQRLVIPLLLPFMKAPAQGAATSIHLASAPDLELVTGQRFVNRRPPRAPVPPRRARYRRRCRRTTSSRSTSPSPGPVGGVM